MSQIPKLSIVVATYRRQEHLTNLLNTLRAQTAPPGDFEIIIVDNESQPNSEVQALCASTQYHGPTLRYIHHAQPGPSGARNHGVKEARAELVGFLDDDILTPSHWVARVLEVRAKTKADIFGGPYTPFYTSTPPKWFKDKYAGLNFGDQGHWLPRNKQLSAGNMIWSRDLFLKLGGFSERFGFVGNKKRFGEDNELCQRAYMAGFGIWYDPSLMLQHHCRAERMSVRGRMAGIIRHSKMKAHLILRETRATDPRPVFLQMLSISKKLLLCVLRLMWACCMIPFRKREEYPYLENYIVEKIGRELGQVALMLEMIYCLFSNSAEAPTGSK